jgi:membrane DNA delivery protein
MATTPFTIPQDILTVAGSIGAAIIGVAIIAVIVGKNAATASTIQAASGGLSQVIGAAVAPVSGGTSGASPSSPLGDLGSPIAGNANGIAGNGSGLFPGGINAPSTSNPFYIPGTSDVLGIGPSFDVNNLGF